MAIRIYVENVRHVLRCRPVTFLRQWCKNMITPFILAADRPSSARILVQSRSLDRRSTCHRACKTRMQKWWTTLGASLVALNSLLNQLYLTTFDTGCNERHHGLNFYRLWSTPIIGGSQFSKVMWWTLSITLVGLGRRMCLPILMNFDQRLLEF